MLTIPLSWFLSWPSVEAIEKKVEQFLSAVLNGDRAQNHFHSTIQQRSAVLQADYALAEEEILKERDAAKIAGDKSEHLHGRSFDT